MDSERDFYHESVEDKDSIVKYLHTLSEGFHSRKLEFSSGGNRIVFEPTGLIQVEIKAKNRNGKTKLSVKFAWKEEPRSKGKRSNSIHSDRG